LVRHFRVIRVAERGTLGSGIDDTLAEPPPISRPFGLKSGRLLAREELSDDVRIVIVDAAAIAATG
jgi:hypothetical protein